MTRVGLITDIHFSYTHGNKLTLDGVNQREQDVYLAGIAAAYNLIDAKVDVVVDLGDMAHVPAPRKRAVTALMRLLQMFDVDYYSANGNHTLQRSSTDMHLYDLLTCLAPNFYGVKSAQMTHFGGYLIPYGTTEDIKRDLDAMPHDALFVAGHWAAEDVPWPGAHVPLADLPKHIPTFLGHYHTRSYRGDNNYKMLVMAENDYPVYIGSTERFSWGEWNNPTGVAVYDTDTKLLEFIDHFPREWVDIVVDPDDYLEPYHYVDIEGKIVRVTVSATPSQYNALDLVAVKKKLVGSLESTIRRAKALDEHSARPVSAQGFSLLGEWSRHVANAKFPRGISKLEVEKIGSAAIDAAGGA